jgi:SAM-dependent methyltransferase
MKDNWSLHPTKIAKLALKFLGNTPGTMIDIGCGNGRDIFFLQYGWKIVAIDQSLDAIKSYYNTLSLEKQKYLTIQDMRFESLELFPVEFIHAAYSLYFCTPDKFSFMWETICSNIKKGGLFSGNFIGNKDDWRKRSLTPKKFVTYEELYEMFIGFDLKYFCEQEFDGPFLDKECKIREKHWHTFDIIARKH